MQIKWDFTHYSCGSSSHHAVQDERGDEAGLLRAGVRLHQLRVITEETLHMHAEQVRALHVVGQQHRAGHDDELEEKHVGARESQKVEKVERKKKKKKKKNGKEERGSCQLYIQFADGYPPSFSF